MSYTFDGPNRRVVLGAGTVTLTLADLWSRWKDWVRAGNAGYLPAFDTVGGDIPAIPLYLFPINDWRIVPQSANHVLDVVGGILATADNSDPFVDPAGAYKIHINRLEPGVAIGYSTTGGSGPTASAIAAAVRAELAVELANMVPPADIATAVWGKTLP